MEELKEVRIPKVTGTYADVLQAVGVATLVAELGNGQNSVTIADGGGEYIVLPAQPLKLSPKDVKLSVGYPYLAHEKAPPPPAALAPEPYPYVEEKRKEEQRKEYYKAQNAEGDQRKARRRKKSGEDLASEPPRPDNRLDLFKCMNSLWSGSQSWNNLARAIQEQIDRDARSLVEYVGTRLARCSSNSSSIEQNLQIGKVSVGILQAYLPTAGKGTNRVKPDGAKLDNLKEPWLDWFEEWCKYRGVWYTLNARFLGKKGKDLKFAALLPGTQVTLSTLRNIVDEFVEGAWSVAGRAFTNIKSDVFATLGLARWLIEHSEFAPTPENRLYRFFKTRQSAKPKPRDVIAGISTAYFKSLGTGRALANTSNVLLPDWFPLTSATYSQWLAVLDEHKEVLRDLDEEKAEEAALLTNYRDALSSNALDLYLDFFADYGAHYLRSTDLYFRYRSDGNMLKAQEYRREQFTISRLEVLIMGLSRDLNSHIGELVKDQAFLALADAIHEATVKAQYWKGQNQQEWDIHYGLAQQWKRAADRGLEFVHELTDFVRLYNGENAKRMEKPEQVRFRRADIARADLDRVLAYVTSGKVETRTLCLLLLAYGFAMTDDERERVQAARDKKQMDQATASVKS